MKFGTGYAYWGTEWKCDYLEMVNKVADIGFDVLEIGADHLQLTAGRPKNMTWLLRMKQSAGREWSTLKRFFTKWQDWAPKAWWGLFTPTGR